MRLELTADLATLSHVGFPQTLQTTGVWVAHRHGLAAGGTGVEAERLGHAWPQGWMMPL